MMLAFVGMPMVVPVMVQLLMPVRMAAATTVPMPRGVAGAITWRVLLPMPMEMRVVVAMIVVAMAVRAHRHRVRIIRRGQDHCGQQIHDQSSACQDGESPASLGLHWPNEPGNGLQEQKHAHREQRHAVH
eukprot:scaffold2008_cov283-Pinguiococcus_pyrenoidosus.AAC.5